MSERYFLIMKAINPLKFLASAYGEIDKERKHILGEVLLLVSNK
jgi:hypothetical protein